MRRVLMYAGCAALSFGLAGAHVRSADLPSNSEIRRDGVALVLEDYASLPLSSPTRAGLDSTTVDFQKLLGRATLLRDEPSGSPHAGTRLLVDDQSGTLYFLSRETRKFTAYLRFVDIFPKFVSDIGNTTGINSFAFDPGYVRNGRFYTVHTELPSKMGSAVPTDTRVPALDLKGYALTTAVALSVGSVHLESVLIEWTDTNIRNAVFEGTVREILRVAYDRNHPMGDVVFNPLARPRENDYGNLYIGVGDGASGETLGPAHGLPQQLGSMMGKILRITPDLSLHPEDPLGPNGRYRIPSSAADPNPFLWTPGARPEVFAYGLRNPHRLTWDVVSRVMLVDDIGLRSWEEVNVVIKGANYGYAEREGHEQLFVGATARGLTNSQMRPPVPFPAHDVLQVAGVSDHVTPLYPALAYSHREGDAIGSGVVYRGKMLPQLRGKYIFTDITTARVFYADVKEMIAARGARGRQATIHELQIRHKMSATAQAVPRRLYDVIAEAYSRKGGRPPAGRVLPGGGAATGTVDPDGINYGGGRADTRILPDADGELYVLTKADGMIRKVTAVAARSVTGQ